MEVEQSCHGVSKTCANSKPASHSLVVTTFFFSLLFPTFLTQPRLEARLRFDRSGTAPDWLKAGSIGRGGGRGRGVWVAAPP